MIVFDLFVDIESTHEFQIHFFQIFKISSEKRVLAMIEVPVGWVESDSRLGKSISRSTGSIWTNPVGVRPIDKRFLRKYHSCGHH